MTELEKRAARMKWNPPAAGSKARLEMPSSAFLLPASRRYPYKVLIDGQWVVSEPGLRSAISVANSQRDLTISQKASRLLDGLQQPEELKHYGVLGMRWGVRKTAIDRPTPSTKGGKPRKETRREKKDRQRKEDEKNRKLKATIERRAKGQQEGAKPRIVKAKKTPISEMSTADLQAMVSRFRLEREYTQIMKELNSSGMTRAKKIVGDILLDVGKTQAKNYLNRSIGGYINKKKPIGNMPK